MSSHTPLSVCISVALTVVGATGNNASTITAADKLIEYVVQHKHDAFLGDSSSQSFFKSVVSSNFRLSPEQITKANTQLLSSTFLFSHSPTIADIAFYVSIRFNHWNEWKSGEFLKKFPNVFRLIDLFNHSPIIAQHSAKCPTASADAAQSHPPPSSIYSALLSVREVKKEEKKDKSVEKEKDGKQQEKDGKKEKQQHTQQQTLEEKKHEPADKTSATSAKAKEKSAKDGKAKDKKAESAPAAAAIPACYRLDLRVGRVLHVDKHPTEAHMYVEDIDIGESVPKRVVSGIANFISAADFKDKTVVLLCNVKAAEVKGVASAGLVLVGTAPDGNQKELLSPPAGAKVGEKIVFAGVPADAIPDNPLQPKNLHELKKKLIIAQNGNAQYDGIDFSTSAGPATFKTLKAGTIA